MQSTSTSIQDTSQNPYGKRKVNPIKVGEIFSTNDGSVKVMSYTNSTSVQVIFIETLTLGTFTAANLRNGRVKDYASPSLFGVGFIGLGIHKLHINSQITKVGSLWINALKRCYFLPVQASYSRTTVSDEFHNFQMFAEWYLQQQNRQFPDLELDKDLLAFLRGSQSAPQYSATTCALIPASLNLKLSKFQRKLKQLKAARSVSPLHAVLPVGINFDKSHLNFRVSVNRELVGSKRKLSEALNLYEEANIRAFITEVERHQDTLSTEVLAEFAAYKLRINHQFPQKTKA
jgi:hypothetical protein